MLQCLFDINSIFLIFNFRECTKSNIDKQYVLKPTNHKKNVVDSSSLYENRFCHDGNPILFTCSNIAAHESITQSMKLPKLMALSPRIVFY